MEALLACIGGVTVFILCCLGIAFIIQSFVG